MHAETLRAKRAERLESRSGLDPMRPVDFNGPVDRPFEPVPESAFERPLFETIAAVAARAPDAIAVEAGGAELSYGDLVRQATCLADSIAQRVERGEPVGIALPNGITAPVAMLAALAVGRPFVPLDLTYPPERNAFIVRQSGMRAIIVDRDTSAAIGAIEGAPPRLDFAAGMARGNATACVASPHDAARITYTSGSEGRPKGVYKTQQAVLHQASTHIRSLHLSAGDRYIMLLGLSVSAAQRRVWASLLSGGRIVIVDLRREGLQEAARVMARRGITIFASPPFVFRRLMELCRDPASVATIRDVNVSGDRVFTSDLALFRERFPASCLFSTNIGSSEAGTYGSWFVPRDTVLDQPLMPVGYTLPDYEVRVVDEAGHAVPRGEVGEITVAGRYVSDGYWRDEERSHRAFSVDPDDPKRRINHTGDLGRMHADGRFELLGRRDRQLKIRGMRVEPIEVEATLRQHVAIGDAAIIPRPVGDGIEIIAYVSLHPEAPPPTEADLVAWLAARLPHAMRPRRIYVVPALPTLGNFKPDLRKLEAFDRERAASEADAAAARRQAPASGLSVREAVRSRWERVLGANSFAADLSWEDAGGESLKALELVFALEEMLHRPVAMGLVGPATRPSELIAALEAVGQTTASQAAALSQGRMRLFFCPGYSGLVFHESVFVQALARHVTIEVLDYPPVVPARLKPIVFDDIVTHVVNAIHARWSGDEPIGLVGYSLGGYVAFAAACRLKAAGIDLAYLGLVDVSAPGRGPISTDLVPDPPHQARNTPLGKLGTVMTRPRYAFDRLITIGVDTRRFTRLAWLWRALVALRLRRAQVRFRVLTMRLLRGRARVGHSFVPYPGPLSLFFARDNKAWSQTDLPEDLGWGDWCTGTETCRIPGDHVGMLASGNLDQLTHAILAQCEHGVAAPEPEEAPVAGA